jgi:putative resolvase
LVVKLSDYAREEGVHYITAYRWWREGKLPLLARQLPSGVIVVDKPRASSDGVALYARVSSSDQREDLDRQVGRLATWVTAQGLQVTGTVAEVGSGLNGSRTKLKRLLADRQVGTIVVEHRERLACFGVEYVEAALAAWGRQLVVVEERELDDDLVRDITGVLTLMCARLYGRRSARRRAERCTRQVRPCRRCSSRRLALLEQDRHRRAGHALGRPTRIQLTVSGDRGRVSGSGLVVAEGRLMV